MKRVMFQADEELIERVRRRADERGVSFAQMVREALEQAVGPATPPPPTSIVGIFASPDGDLSERASRDEYEPSPFRSS